MSAQCVPPSGILAKAMTAYRNRRQPWLADTQLAEQDSLTIALHPPSEREVATDPDAVVAWARSWRSYSSVGLVEWESRRWPSFGTQEVPIRVILTGAAEIAAAAGRGSEWHTLEIRRQRLLADLGPGTPTLPAAIAATATKWLALDENDFERLINATLWLTANPDSGLFIRQLPVPGVDTKWIARHRSLLESLLAGIRGHDDLGVIGLPRMCEIAVCDRALLPGAPRIFATSTAELAALQLHPARVLILENKEGLYALPTLPETVAIHGGGYAVGELAAILWIHASEIWYWGDLDSHGFAILNALRHHLPETQSLLMDATTLNRWMDLVVGEPTPTNNELPLLTDSEQTALAVLRTGDLRLEQERIPWPYVLERLHMVWDLPAQI